MFVNFNVWVCVLCVFTILMCMLVLFVSVYHLVSYVFLTLIVIESLNNYQASRPHTIVIPYVFEKISWPN